MTNEYKPPANPARLNPFHAYWPQAWLVWLFVLTFGTSQGARAGR